MIILLSTIIGDILFFGLPASVVVSFITLIVLLVLKKKVTKILVVFLLLLAGYLWFANSVASYLHLGGR